MLYCAKPQPLSPYTKTFIEGGVRYRIVKGRKLLVKRVPTTNSIYYLWFEYLKRSEKYKTACDNNGKDILDIGLQVKWVSGAEAKNLIEDNRSKGKEVD